jgi:thiamine biosynthesis lipoprotein
MPHFPAPVLAALALPALLAGCATRRGGGEEARFEFSRPQMGVPFRLVLYARDGQSATNAAEAAWARVAELNAALSDYDPDSELSRLSQRSGSGGWVPVGDDLWRVLTAAQALSRRTEGAFDVTVGPVVNLWRKARRERQLPQPALLAEARARVGWRHVELDARRRAVRLAVPDMRLDLGGIAKGYAVDEALAVLAAHGIRSALVSGGGDLAVSGPPPGRPGWRVELAAHDATNAPPQAVRLRHAALATSGDVFQFVEIAGLRYSHIVDPRTGIGLTDHGLVTVIARDCMTADSLATAAGVLGPAEGAALVQAAPGAAARLLRLRDGRLEATETRGFRRWLEPQAERGAAVHPLQRFNKFCGRPRESAGGRPRRPGVRWQSAAAPPLSAAGPAPYLRKPSSGRGQSGGALRFRRSP